MIIAESLILLNHAEAFTFASDFFTSNRACITLAFIRVPTYFDGSNLVPHLLTQTHDLESLKVAQLSPPVELTLRPRPRTLTPFLVDFVGVPLFP